MTDQPSAASTATRETPIDMLLWCPDCGAQHVDAPDGEWANPPHHSHLCHKCGTVWRPADVPTNGVAAIATRGKGDTWSVQSDVVPVGRTEARDELVNLIEVAVYQGTRRYLDADELLTIADFVLSRERALRDEIGRYQAALGKANDDLMGMRDGALLRDLQSQLARERAAAERARAEGQKIRAALQLVLEELDDPCRRMPLCRWDDFSKCWQQDKNSHTLHLSLALDKAVRSALAQPVQGGADGVG